MMTSNKIITNRKKILEVVKQDGGALEYALISLPFLWSPKTPFLWSTKTP